MSNRMVFNFKPLWIVRIGQGHNFSDSGIQVIEGFMMYFGPKPDFFLKIVDFWQFSALNNKAWEGSKHFAALFSKDLYDIRPSQETYGSLWHFWVVIIG